MLSAITLQRCVHYQRGILFSIHSRLRLMSAISHHLSLDSVASECRHSAQWGPLAASCFLAPLSLSYLKMNRQFSEPNSQVWLAVWSGRINPSPVFVFLKWGAGSIKCLMSLWLPQQCMLVDHHLFGDMKTRLLHLVSFTSSPDQTT